MKQNRHVDFILTIAEGWVSCTFQVQYYAGGDFVGERHWTLAFGWGWPPVQLIF